jgi:hypothetical protein
VLAQAVAIEWQSSLRQQGSLRFIVVVFCLRAKHRQQGRMELPFVTLRAKTGNNRERATVFRPAGENWQQQGTSYCFSSCGRKLATTRMELPFFSARTQNSKRPKGTRNSKLS